MDFQEKIAKLEIEIYKLKKYINKLEKEKKQLEKLIEELEDKHHNERGAGRKPKLTNQEKEMVKMYSMQGKKLKEIATMFNCSVTLVHNILKESKLNKR